MTRKGPATSWEALGLSSVDEPPFAYFHLFMQPFSTSVPHGNHRTQKMIWVTIFSTLPRIIHNQYQSGCRGEKQIHYIPWMSEGPGFFSLSLLFVTCSSIFHPLNIGFSPWPFWNFYFLISLLGLFLLSFILESTEKRQKHSAVVGYFLWQWVMVLLHLKIYTQRSGI